jgi:hypothetical protein
LFLFAWNVRNNDAVPGTPEYAWKIPDPTLTQVWALEIRMLRLWILYPLLILFDLETLIGNIVRYFQGNSSSIDIQNTILATHASKTYMPTPTSRLAFKILKKCNWDYCLTQFFTNRPDQPPIDDALRNLMK